MPAAQIDNSSKRNAAIAEMENRKQRKKILIAIGLIVIMAVLWIRLLSRKNVPADAVAVISNSDVQIVPAASPSIIYSELPIISGRNDILKRDIFASNGWKDFKSASGENANIEESNSPYISAEMSEAVDALELTAIITGNPKQAFIDDKLMVTGQKFNFIFKNKKYEFKIAEINDLQVKLDCCGRTVVKKIVQPIKMP